MLGILVHLACQDDDSILNFRNFKRSFFNGQIRSTEDLNVFNFFRITKLAYLNNELAIDINWNFEKDIGVSPNVILVRFEKSGRFSYAISSNREVHLSGIGLIKPKRLYPMNEGWSSISKRFNWPDKLAVIWSARRICVPVDKEMLGHVSRIFFFTASNKPKVKDLLCICEVSEGRFANVQPPLSLK